MKKVIRRRGWKTLRGKRFASLVNDYSVCLLAKITRNVDAHSESDKQTFQKAKKQIKNTLALDKSFYTLGLPSGRRYSRFWKGVTYVGKSSKSEDNVIRLMGP